MTKKMKQKNYDLRTALQKAADLRRANILARFKEIRSNVSAETSNNRIMVVLSDEFGCTPQNVYYYIKKAGLMEYKGEGHGNNN